MADKAQAEAIGRLQALYDSGPVPLSPGCTYRITAHHVAEHPPFRDPAAVYDVEGRPLA